MHFRALRFGLLIALIPWISFAADNSGYGNIFYGLSVPDSANTTKHTVYGFTGGSRVSENISIGGYHALSSRENATGGIPFSFSLTGLETRVYVRSGETNIFVGLRAGITKINTTSSGSEIIFSPYHYGIVSGYNFTMWSKMTIGFEGSFLAIEESKTYSGSSSVSKDAFHTINFFVTSGVSF